MDKKALLELLADNQLGDLFNALKDQQGHYKELVLLESKWNDLRAKQRNDLISHEQANLESAQIRNSLLQLIELSDRPYAATSAYSSAGKTSTPSWIWILAAVVGLSIIYAVYHFTSDRSADGISNSEHSNTSAASPAKTKGSPGPLNVSEAQPLTMAAGDTQYERVYSVVKTSVEPTGGGKSLITLTIGLNFKGIINDLLSSEKFRLVAEELPGPMAPSNFLSKLVDSRSYVEGDIKFELSDDIRRFTIIVEGKEDKLWKFSR